jgi:hypothetical protein
LGENVDNHEGLRPGNRVRDLGENDGLPCHSLLRASMGSNAAALLAG